MFAVSVLWNKAGSTKLRLRDRHSLTFAQPTRSDMVQNHVGGSRMETFVQDLRYALRSLLKSPRFTVTALITLTLGIAATVAIFTFDDAALIRPLPYRDSSGLFEVYETRQMEVFTQFEASYPDFLDWRAQNQVFDNLAAYQRNGVIMRGSGTPRLVTSAVVTDNFFSMLGVKPAHGRDFRSG